MEGSFSEKKRLTSLTPTVTRQLSTPQEPTIYGIVDVGDACMVEIEEWGPLTKILPSPR